MIYLFKGPLKIKMHLNCCNIPKGKGVLFQVRIIKKISLLNVVSTIREERT